MMAELDLLALEEELFGAGGSPNRDDEDRPVYLRPRRSYDEEDDGERLGWSWLEL